jgi:hypothetical protein
VAVLTTFDDVDALDEVEDELPPHAATSMHAAPSRNSSLKRFIDTLRSDLI